MTEENGNGSEPEDNPGNGAHACPVWVAGRCDGTTCNCPQGGGR